MLPRKGEYVKNKYTSNMEAIIEVKSLKKRYGNIEAVRGISFQVERGCLLAFLGPNGAGKSTSIDILCTLIKCEEGEITIDGLKLGKDDEKIRNLIGIAFQNNLLDNMLTIRENLISRGSMYKIPKKILLERINEISKITEITDFIDRRYEKLSGGQRRRSDLARALINEPKILFLDEPTTGLDPQTRQAIWKTIKQMQAEKNMTVFLTTHYMEEAANADKVIIIKKGLIIEEGTPTQLREKYTKDHLILYGDLEKIENQLNQNRQSYERKQDKMSIPVYSKSEALKLLNQYDAYMDSFEVIKGTMDDVFLNIIGEEEGNCD